MNLKEHDPFGKQASAAELYERLCQLVEGSENKRQGKTTPTFSPKIQDVALLQDLVKDLEFQKKLNQFLRSGAIDAAEGLRKNTCTTRIAKIKSEEKPKRWPDKKDKVVLSSSELRDQLARLTYMGMRTNGLVASAEELGSKLKVVGGKVNLTAPLTPRDAWLVDHIIDDDLYFVRSVVEQNALFKKPIAGQFRGDLQTLSAAQTKAEGLQAKAYENWRPGDIIFQSIPEEAKYKGAEDIDLFHKKMMKHTKSSASHAGVMLSRPTMLHATDSLEVVSIDSEKHGLKTQSSEEVGIAAEAIGFGTESYAKGYRFNLAALAIRAGSDGMLLHNQAEAESKTIDEFLKEKVEKYGKEYEEFAKARFIGTKDEKPHYSISNQELSRYLSVIPKWIPAWIKKRILKANFSEKNFTKNWWKKYSNRVLEEYSKKAASGRLGRSSTIRERATEDRVAADPSGGDVITHEMCSEFAFKESINFVMFIEQKLWEEYPALRDREILSIPEVSGVDFSRLHPGELQKIIDKWVKMGVMEAVGPSSDRFAQSE